MSQRQLLSKSDFALWRRNFEITMFANNGYDDRCVAGKNLRIFLPLATSRRPFWHTLLDGA